MSELLSHTIMNIKKPGKSCRAVYIPREHRCFVTQKLRSFPPCFPMTKEETVHRYAFPVLRKAPSSPQHCCLSDSGCEADLGLMSSFSTAAEVSLRTETRKEGREREGKAVRVTARAGRADLERGGERQTDKKHAMQIYGAECVPETWCSSCRSSSTGGG